MTETVDDLLKRIKSHDIVSLSYFRHVMETYKGWKPLSYEEFRLKLQGDANAVNRLRMAEERKIDNERVKRANRLKTPPKKDK